jgi:hypothetical protein
MEALRRSDLAQQLAVSVTVFAVQDDFAAGRTEITRHGRNGGAFAFVDIVYVAGIVDQFSRSTAWAFHGHSSLNETIKTSSMTVSLRYTLALWARVPWCAWSL